jgi:hypothetical protein
MYLPIPPQLSNARAWVAAAAAVQAEGGEAHNVIIDIANPVAEDAIDTAIIQAVDTSCETTTHIRSPASQIPFSLKPFYAGTGRQISTMLITESCLE